MIKLLNFDKLFPGIAGMILFFIFFCLLLATGGFLLNQSITAYYLPIAAVLSFILSFFLINEIKIFLISLVLFVLILIGSYYLSISFYDLSWDGMAYHQETIVQLAKGWNPTKSEADSIFSEWISPYQKGVEIVQTIIYSYTDKIESGKTVNILLFIATFLISVSTIRLYIRSYLDSFFISILCVFCPIVSSQIFTYYIDFTYYLLLVCAIGILLSVFKLQERKYLLLFVAISVLLCSIKFSTIPTFVLLCIGLIVYTFWKKKYNYIKPIFISLFSVFVFCIITNFNPLVTNLMNGKHIFFPLMGDEKIDIMSYNSPPYFLEKGRFTKLSYSLFSECSNTFEGTKDPKLREYKPKLPFTINGRELEAMESPAIRLSGFGPFYSGIFLITILILISILFYSVRLKNKNNKDLFFGSYFIIFFILLSTAINPEMWWARYVPQLWLVSIISLVMIWNLKLKYFRVLKIFLTGAMFFNIYILSTTVFGHQGSGTKKINKLINELKEDKVKVKIDEKIFIHHNLRLKENNIPYEKGKIIGESFDMPLSFGNVKLQEISKIKRTDTISLKQAFGSNNIMLSDLIKNNQESTIIISAKDEATKGLATSDLKNLKSSGLNIQDLKHRGSYVAIIKNGEMLLERINNSDSILIKNNEKLKELGILKIISSGYMFGNKSEIRTEFGQLSLNKRGLNIVLIKNNEAIYLLHADTFKSNKLDTIVYQPIFFNSL